MSDAFVLKLVELYESKPELWNPNLESYHVKNDKFDAWCYIADTLGIDADVAKTKITSLLSSYRREKAKEKNSKRTGSGEWNNIFFITHHQVHKFECL